MLEHPQAVENGYVTELEPLFKGEYVLRILTAVTTQHPPHVVRRVALDPTETP